MKSAIRLVVGLSIFAGAVSAVGCSSSDSGGPVAVAGSSNTGTAGATGSSGSTGSAGSGGGAAVSGIPLTPTDGWVDGMSNSAGIQGALYTYADPTSTMGLTDGIKTGMNCMKGTAAKVDLMCVKPAGMDCYGVTWGAAMGLNLNQPNVTDDAGMSMGGTPVPFDLSAKGITGFSFNITGDTIPAGKDFRFLIEDGTTSQYCTKTTAGVKAGLNTFALKDLIQECWAPTATDKTGDTAASSVVKIAWQIVTNSSAAVPFDFCVDSIVATTN